MVGPAAHDNPQAHTGAYGQVGRRVQALRAAPGPLAQGGGIDICIKPHRDPQRLPETRRNGEPPPGRLGRGKDGAVLRGTAVQPYRAKAADPHCRKGLAPEEGQP